MGVATVRVTTTPNDLIIKAHGWPVQSMRVGGLNVDNLKQGSLDGFKTH